MASAAACVPRAFPVRVGGQKPVLPLRSALRVLGYLVKHQQREVGEGDITWAPGWFWKQKNNLLLKQPDWFALEGLCLCSCAYKYQRGTGGVSALGSSCPTPSVS